MRPNRIAKKAVCGWRILNPFLNIVEAFSCHYSKELNEINISVFSKNPFLFILTNDFV